MKIKIESSFHEWMPSYGVTVSIWEWIGSKWFGKKGKLLCVKNFKNELEAGEFIIKLEAYYKYFNYG